MNQLPRTSAKDLLNYGLLGWALGAVAVPIYIQVPYLYSRIYEVPSAWVGIILLLSRLLDAVLDPAIGLWVDRRSGQGNRYALPLLLAVPLLLWLWLWLSLSNHFAKSLLQTINRLL